MKYHTLIGKFMGIWRSEKFLLLWIKDQWKLKGRIDLKLGSNGFFIAIFLDHSEQEKVFEEGPYFFNSIDVHMRYWTK